MSNAASEQHSIIGVGGEFDKQFQPNTHKDAKWFLEGGKLGLFIHWGICTVNGDIDLSWGMMANKPYELNIGYNKFISPREYFSLAKSFKPDKFDIDHVLYLAKSAGFDYAVFTTKHHDGFALWPSDYGDFNIGKIMKGVDFVADYVKACRKNGLKTGLYYSPPDWYFFRNNMSFNYAPNFPEGYHTEIERCDYDTELKPAVIESPSSDMQKEFEQYIRNQITELLTEYGKIDIMWFDGAASKNPCISIEEMRKLQPGIVVNPRLHNTGDFQTFECKMPQTFPSGAWEYEDIWAEGPWWAYIKGQGYQSAEWALSQYNKVCEEGGNFLLNIGPMADGSIPLICEKRLVELKELRYAK